MSSEKAQKFAKEFGKPAYIITNEKYKSRAKHRVKNGNENSIIIFDYYLMFISKR